jgi:hypothetical protein
VRDERPQRGSGIEKEVVLLQQDGTREEKEDTTTQGPTKQDEQVVA